MTEISAGDISTKSIALPFFLVPTPASRNVSPRHVVLGALIVSIIAAGGVFAFLDSVAWSIGIGVGIMLVIVALLWRAVSRPDTSVFPHGSVEVGAERIRCKALVDGDSAWGELTAFRWILQQDKKGVVLYERGDGTGVNNLPAEEFVVEAAELRDASQTNEYGYYDRGAIQFELDGLCFTPPTRQDADAVVGMLNGLQAAAAAGTLRDGDMVEVPAILNAVSPAEPAQAPILPERVATVRR
jgi:hypothetical protein